mgnify:FL=1
MIRAIVYDAVGTLLHVVPSVAEIYAAVGQRYGSRRSVEEVRRRFVSAYAAQDRIDALAEWRTDEARERQRWLDIVTEVLDDALPPTTCFETLWARFSHADAWRLDADAESVLRDFHARGIRQAIASNFDQRLRGILAETPIHALIDPVIISSEIGWRKPSPQFFAHVIQALDVPADEILFVGDDRVNDYEPALRAGMRATLVGGNLREVMNLEFV